MRRGEVRRGEARRGEVRPRWGLRRWWYQLGPRCGYGAVCAPVRRQRLCPIGIALGNCIGQGTTAAPPARTPPVSMHMLDALSTRRSERTRSDTLGVPTIAYGDPSREPALSRL